MQEEKEEEDITVRMEGKARRTKAAYIFYSAAAQISRYLSKLH